ncbi:MAG TPA: LysR family transcriptional regulator [Terrimicrobiaceae bacterium]
MREIRSFVLLAQQLHFGRTARLLHLSQPALTKQIRRIEDDLGCSLFERGKHGTRLTSAGELFLEDARPLVSGFDRLIEGGRRLACGESGRLRIGFGFHTFELVPRLIGRLRQTTPGVQISLRDMSTLEQTEALRSGRIDAGFVRAPVPREFEAIPVIRDRLVLVSSSDSRLSENATLKDCAQEPFILISNERAPTFRRHVIELCAKFGFHPRVIQDTSEVTTSLALVQAGLGITLIPHSFAIAHIPGVRLHDLSDPAASWGVSAAWRRDDPNPVLKRFLELLRQEITSG